MVRLNTIVADIAAENRRYERAPQGKRTGHPFVTISRQAGAAGEAVMEKLVERLRALDPADPPWHGFDRELVEKVAKDHKLSRFLIESLEEREYHWLRETLLGLGASPDWPSDTAVYHRVAKTVWALAQAGRVVIVGRGGVFLTQSLPNGVHVRLVAPFEARVKRYAAAQGVAPRQARRAVREIEQRRAAFYKRYWPSHSLEAETFTAVFNTGQLDDERIVQAVAALVPGLQPAGQRETVKR